MAIEQLLAKVSRALGIPQDEIDEAIMPPEQLEVIRGAEEALEIAKGGCRDCELDDADYEQIAKRTFSAEERRQARFSIDGRFPMNNCSDVSNARQALGRANPADRPRIEALIRRAAKALNCNIEGSVVQKGVESADDLANVEGMDETTGTVEENTGSLEERVTDLETSIEELPGKIAKAMQEAQSEEQAEEAPTPAELSEKLDKLAGQVLEVGEKIEKLGAGASAQTPDPAETEIAKSEKVAKAFEDRGLPSDLAGIL